MTEFLVSTFLVVFLLPEDYAEGVPEPAHMRKADRRGIFGAADEGQDAAFRNYFNPILEKMEQLLQSGKQASRRSRELPKQTGKFD